jgi:hypothetical protein
MTADSERFRRRACHCRELAMQARTSDWRNRLDQIATELEQEADAAERIERRLARLNIPPTKE